MVETNSASQLTSNYVLSPTNRLEAATTPRRLRASRFRPILPSISSLPAALSSYASSQESRDAPSDPSHDSNVQTSVDHNVDKHRPIFKLNALFVQALLYPITVVIYLLIGAAIFTAIEHEHEQMAREASLNNAIQTMAALQEIITAMLNNLNISKNVSTEMLNDFTSNFTNLCADYSQTPSYNQWEFLPSFYFAATVITTIGYGHVSPRTTLGRAFLCVYALMGIPLLIVCLITIGKYLSGAWDATVSRIRSKRSRLHKYKEICFFVILLVLAFIVVVLIPAIIFERIEENLSYGDAVYFAIVSLTTVGLGDIVPDPGHLKELSYIVLYLTWLFTGFAIVSVLVTKMSGLYTRMNKSIIVRSKRCFKRCFRVKRNDHQPPIDENSQIMELSSNL